LEGNYKIFIPTRDSGRWIGGVLDFYRDLGLGPFIVVDARTSDNTREIINQHGLDFLEFAPRADFPEAGMLEFAASHAGVNWLLRIDDDELPSKGLIDFVTKKGVHSKNQCIFIERRELFRDGRNIVYSQSPGKYPLPAYPQRLHPMARFFHVDRVEYLEEIHTTGFQDLKLYGFAPTDACLIHFNCLLHDFESRLEKIKKYALYNRGVSYALADEYLPELFDDTFHRSSRAGLDEFQSFLAKIPQAGKFDPERMTSDDRSLLYSAVYERVKQLQVARDASAGPIPDADAIKWTERLPESICVAAAKFLCSMPSSKLNKYGTAVWDYYSLHKKSNG
jgi:hypothetical protein